MKKDLRLTRLASLDTIARFYATDKDGHVTAISHAPSKDEGCAFIIGRLSGHYILPGNRIGVNIKVARSNIFESGKYISILLMKDILFVTGRCAQSSIIKQISHPEWNNAGWVIYKGIGFFSEKPNLSSDLQCTCNNLELMRQGCPSARGKRCRSQD